MVQDSRTVRAAQPSVSSSGITPNPARRIISRHHGSRLIMSRPALVAVEDRAPVGGCSRSPVELTWSERLSAQVRGSARRAATVYRGRQPGGWPGRDKRVLRTVQGCVARSVSPRRRWWAAESADWGSPIRRCSSDGVGDGSSGPPMLRRPAADVCPRCGVDKWKQSIYSRGSACTRSIRRRRSTLLSITPTAWNSRSSAPWPAINGDGSSALVGSGRRCGRLRKAPRTTGDSCDAGLISTSSGADEETS